nr:OmpA family protein [Marivibrio halodurans]
MEEPVAAPSQSDSQTQVAAVDPSVVVERPEGLAVLFEPGAQDLPAGAEAALNAIADQMKADSDLRLRLRGYALADGDTANQSRRVSLFRALAVRTYLMKRDVNSRRMDVQALGSNLPEDGGAANRVDVLIQR